VNENKSNIPFLKEYRSLAPKVYDRINKEICERLEVLTVTPMKNTIFKQQAVCCCMLGFAFSPDDGDSMFI
jgi:hypothetical protein